ncbi:uncharacterized protein LOC106669591 [Cimex lectularius]|uniref:Telomeric repeat-binding factor 2-interacting protein 1 n=1 Tax=Cimex lectularius TaxID=79782 RepID=A0A8I6TJA0_CIMLE|nr:uncharacterized protein LOC106669591 [Cimex lectularius]XP_014254655.1 uncharacterized protein LOC106669591 [Cimex lectularius]
MSIDELLPILKENLYEVNGGNSNGIFISERGYAISFCLLLSDPNEKHELTNLIWDSGGRVEQDLTNLLPRTVVLVDGEESVRHGVINRISFKSQYVKDCVNSCTLLPLNNYVYGVNRNVVDNFFEVIYYRTRVFKFLDEPSLSGFVNCYTVKCNDVNEKCTSELTLKDETNIQPTKEVKKLPRINENYQKNIAYKKLIAKENSDDDDDFGPMTFAKQTKLTYKSPYTRQEKEAILKFLIRKNYLTGLRGSLIWKEMEKAQICPNRTYQSLKNHFLKTLIFELDRYNFLTYDEKIMMRGNKG